LNQEVIKSKQSKQNQNIRPKPHFIAQLRDGFGRRFPGPGGLLQGSFDIFLFFQLFELILVVHFLLP
jgi:hypothetical protein